MKNSIEGYKGRTLADGDKVSIYRNLHVKKFSIVKQGRVHAHEGQVALRNVSFYSQKSGREKVRKAGQKNVHAGARGLVVLSRGEEIYDIRDMTPIYYNPYTLDGFVELGINKYIEHADFVVCVDGKIYANGLRHR